MATGQDRDSDTATTERPAAKPRRAERAATAYEAARNRTLSTIEATRDRATRATRDALDQASVYPVAAVLGGLAVGAVLAALLPASRAERNLLGSTGRRLTGAAREVAQRGVEMAKGQVDEIRDRAAKKVGEVVVDAVGASKD